MIKILFVFVVFLVSGCGTFSIKNLEKSDAALEFAKKSLSNVDYSKLSEKIKLPKSRIKSVGPVQLYSAETVPLFIEQNTWNYVQRVKREDGIECYAYVRVGSTSSNSFELAEETPGKFYCFESADKYQSVSLF